MNSEIYIMVQDGKWNKLKSQSIRLYTYLLTKYSYTTLLWNLSL